MRRAASLLFAVRWRGGAWAAVASTSACVRRVLFAGVLLAAAGARSQELRVLLLGTLAPRRPAVEHAAEVLFAACRLQQLVHL